MSKPITKEQRYAISRMLQIPFSIKAIAEAIGVNKSSVYREIKRNCDGRNGNYNIELAQRKAEKNHLGALLTINDRVTGRVWIHQADRERSHPCCKNYNLGTAQSKKLNTYNNG